MAERERRTGGRYRRAASATLPTFRFLPALVTAFTLLGMLLALWSGIGVLRGLWQGAVFGLGAALGGAIFTFIRFAAKPELLGSPDASDGPQRQR